MTMYFKHLFLTFLFGLFSEQKSSTFASASCYNPESHTELTLKLAVFADHALHHKFVKEYGIADADKKLRDYIFTLLHHTQQLFTNLKPRIKIIVVEFQVFQNKLRHVSEKRLKQNMAYYMDMFCHYQKQRNYKKIWSHAVLLSGFDLVYGNEDEFSGYSTAESVCRPISCSIVEATSFKSAYTLAHEIGHALGMRHDNGSNGCHPGCCLMSPVIYSGSYNWSQCSRDQMAHYLRTIPCKAFCLMDHNAQGINYISTKLPGQKFSLDDQCRLYLGSCYQHYITNDQDISSVCESLWCTNGQNIAKEAHAALEGSYCGDHKWCIGGKCINISNEYRNEVVAVDGQWSEWRNVAHDGKCGSAGCSECQIKGQNQVRRQVRTCSNPSTNNGGKSCEGGAIRGILCDSEANGCNGISSLVYATNQCKRRKTKTAYLSVNLTGEGFQNINSEWPCLVWCKTAPSSYSAYTFFDPLPDGSYCGEKKLCLSGKCMELTKCSNSTYLTEDKSFIHQCASEVQNLNNEWGAWSSCSVTCGIGYRHRTRLCTSISCSKNSKNYQWCRSSTTCHGKNSSVRISAFINNSQKNSKKSTKIESTPSSKNTVHESENEYNLVDRTDIAPHEAQEVVKESNVATVLESFKWSSWEPFSECTKTCGGGVQFARRICIKSVNASKCKGSSLKQRVCNLKRCL